MKGIERLEKIDIGSGSAFRTEFELQILMAALLRGMISGEEYEKRTSKLPKINLRELALDNRF